MKHFKDLGYIFTVIAIVGGILCISTGIIQLSAEAIANGIGFPLKDDWLFSISGGFGTAVTGILCANYVKKKKYTDSIKAREPFQIKNCLYYGTLAWSICSVLFYAITTILFVYVLSMTDEIYVPAEKSVTDILLLDIFFPILMAPVFEELMFRMGIYNMMRHRFGKMFSIAICTLLFAVIHGYSIQGFCACLTAGLLFQLIYTSTGNIWYSIFAHMVCNMSSNISNALEAKGVLFFGIPIQYEIEGFNMVHPVLIIAAVLFCAVCIIKKFENTENIKYIY